MTPPATATWRSASFSCPKLIVSGSNAEQPSPARQNAATEAAGACLGSAAVRAKAAAVKNGRTWYATRLGTHRWITAISTRPTVTKAQKPVSASEAVAGLTPSDVSLSWDQFPFSVSQIPYRKANPPKSQNATGSRAPAGSTGPGWADPGWADPGWADLDWPALCSAGSGLSGSRRLTAMTTASRQATRIGNPTQNPAPLKAATNAGARAVPRPSRALSTRTDLSSASGWKAAANVFSDGTVRPNPAPRQAVAMSSSA